MKTNPVDKDDWRDLALCREVAGDWVNLGNGPDKTIHKRREFELSICEVCAVRRPCFDFGVKIGATEGIWGGAIPGARGVPSARRIRLDKVSK